MSNPEQRDGRTWQVWYGALGLAFAGLMVLMGDLGSARWFAVVGGAALLLALLYRLGIWPRIPQWSRNKGLSVRQTQTLWAGAVMAILGLASLAFGLTQDDPANSARSIVASFLCALVAAWSFLLVFAQRRSARGEIGRLLGWVLRRNHDHPDPGH